MKRISITIMILLFVYKMNAQTLAEWTEQKKTQLKYYAQQITALKTYLGHVKKGYTDVQNGLNTIEDIKEGEWSLHKDFISALKTVNPIVQNYAKPAHITSMQLSIVKETKSLIKECKEGGQFSFAEIGYVQNVCDKLLRESLKHIDELLLVTTSGELQMSEDERIKRIENIYNEMVESRVFLKSFGSDLILLSKGRGYEKREIQLSLKLNDTK